MQILLNATQCRFVFVFLAHLQKLNGLVLTLNTPLKLPELILGLVQLSILKHSFNIHRQVLLHQQCLDLSNDLLLVAVDKIRWQLQKTKKSCTCVEKTMIMSFSLQYRHS